MISEKKVVEKIVQYHNRMSKELGFDLVTNKDVIITNIKENVSFNNRHIHIHNGVHVEISGKENIFNIKCADTEYVLKEVHSKARNGRECTSIEIDLVM